MHNAAFAALGLDWTYELLDVDEAELPGAVASLRTPAVAGANVTIPHKQAVMQSMESLDADALRARAVNTIVNEGGRLKGMNTDVAAIREAARELNVVAASASVVILGTGGAARAAAVALDGAHLSFVARRPETADVPGRVIDWSDPGWPARVRAADLLVNATPLGRKEEMPLRPNALPEHGAVLDLVYVSGGTPLVRKARALGLRTADGWGILLAQGAASFRAWTGKAAPLAAMRETLSP
jgi:shikimate dehydrogenase